MSDFLKPIIVILCILLILYIICRAIRFKLDRFLKSAINMTSKKAARELLTAYKAETDMPLPISQLTAVYKPKIMRDFPETSYEFMEKLAINSLLCAFNCIENLDISDIENSFEGPIQSQVQNVIDDLKSRDERAVYNNVKVHKASISNYKNDNKEATATFEISLEYFQYTQRNGKVISGSRDKKTQAVYKVELLYSQDIEKGLSTVYANNCPNCGAPASCMGSDKSCAYCGSHLVEISSRVWQVAGYKYIK